MVIAEHYQGSYGGFPTPEFVFYIGPCPGNPLNDRQDFERRTEEVTFLLDPSRRQFGQLEAALEQALGVPVERLHARVGMGFWKGTVCPTLCINSLRSMLRTGRILYGHASADIGSSLCRSLTELLCADWIACQHFFGKPFQVVHVIDSNVPGEENRCERNLS